MATLPCPPPEQLRQLLDADTPDERLTAHVGDCPACQRRLEQLAGADPGLLAAASGLHRNVHLGEPQRRRVLENLEADSTLTVPVAAGTHFAWLRSILQATDRPGVLGLFAGYEVIEVIGQGGMGVVLKAHDPALGRRVAIKLLGPEMASDPAARQRFAREARAAAAVRHENVVVIHAVSESASLPYIVMEYIAGGSLQDHLDSHGRLGWETAARLGAEIASGLAAAHARGLIHRDIKPSNILLQPEGSPPPGGARICDFGLARVADESRLTQTGVAAGTPMYMAPEQARCEPLDQRADLFSLGSVLFAACTGQTPFPDGSPLAVLRQVADHAPRSVGEFAPEVPAWLAAIIARLQARRREDRFGSAQEAADLLRHNLAHPEQPRFPPALPLSQDRRRRRLLLAVAGLAMAGLVAGLCLWILGGRTPERPALAATLRGHHGLIWSLAFSPDGRLLATGGDDTTLRLWDADTGKQRAVLTKGGGSVVAVAFAHSDKFLVSGHGDGSLHLWDPATAKELPSIPHSGGTGRRLALSPDDHLLAVGSGNQEIEMWDVERRKLLRTINRQSGTVFAVAFSPDGKTLATGDTSGHVRLWASDTGEKRAEFRGDSLGMRVLAFTQNGKTLISAGSGDHDVKLWDPDTLEELDSLRGYESGVMNLAVSANGRLLATGDRNGGVKLWDLTERQLLAAWPAHRGTVWGLAFGKGGLLATAGEDGLGQLWDLDRFGGGR